MVESIEIEVEDEDMAREIAYGIAGRAADFHDNPDDDHEDVAVRLKEIANRLGDEYGW